MSAIDKQMKRNSSAPVMPEALLEKTIELFQIPSTSWNEISMAIYLCKYLEKISGVAFEIDDYGNIKVTKGEGPYPCFCAHLDTVHTYPSGFQVKFDKGFLYAIDNNNRLVGVGGDDKCGILVCLYLLEKLKNVKIAFFSKEETGVIGSNHISLQFFQDCKFLGGIDRWNGNDFVDKYNGISTVSDDFTFDAIPIFDKFKLSSTHGLFTDSFNVMERRVNISCFNLSCGYYQHHTNKEYVDTQELYNSCLISEELAALPLVYPYKIEYISFYYRNAYNTYNSYNYPTTTVRYCIDCGCELLPEEELRCDLCQDDFDSINENYINKIM